MGDREQRRVTGKVAVFCAAGLMAGAGVGVGYAAIPDADGTIDGCYAKRDGTLRVVEADAGCGRNELPLTWSQTGPAGPAGAAGQDGAQGPPGGEVPAQVRDGTLVSLAPGATGTSHATCLPGEYLVHGNFETGYPGTSGTGTLTSQTARDTNADGITDLFVVGVRNTSEGELLAFTEALCAPLTG